jgi:hypothetical protein
MNTGSRPGRPGGATKGHRRAHAERTAAHLARVALRMADTGVHRLPCDQVVRADALTYLQGLPEACADLAVTSPPIR